MTESYREMQDRLAKAAERRKGVFTLTIPDFVPVLINAWRGRHWSVKHKLQKGQAEMIGTYAMMQGIPKATGKRRVQLTVYKPGKSPDADAWDKSLLDCLVQCGLLTDDSPEGIDGRMAVIVVKAKERRTVVRLEDCK